jgi:hypothetical protein
MVLKRKSGCPDIEEFFLQIEAGNPSYLGVFFKKKKEKASPAKVKREEPKIMPFFELSDSPFLVFQPLLN